MALLPERLFPGVPQKFFRQKIKEETTEKLDEKADISNKQNSYRYRSATTKSIKEHKLPVHNN